MQALILAGGKGTRLRPLTLYTPKPVVPVGNRPFLVHQIELLKRIGIREIILSLGYQPTEIENILGNGSDYGVSLRYLVEPKPLGTAGAYKFAEQHLDSATIVLNGDILTDISLEKVVAHHQGLGADATLVLVEVDNPSAYGLVEVGSNHRIAGFLEKPKPEELVRLKVNTINAGIYILEPKILEYVRQNQKSSFEYDVFPALLKNDEMFCAYVSRGDYWLDIGTHDRYLDAHFDLMNGKINISGVDRQHRTGVSDSAKIDGKSIIGDGCSIESGAAIINSTIGNQVTVESGAVIRDSVIWDKTMVRQDATVSKSILGRECLVGTKLAVNEGSVLGDGSILAGTPDPEFEN